MTRKKRAKIIAEIEKLIGCFRYCVLMMSDKKLKKELKLRRAINRGKYLPML